MAAKALVLASLALYGASGQANSRWERVATTGAALTPRVYSTGWASRDRPDVTIYGGVSSTDSGVQPSAQRLTYDIPSNTLVEAPETLPFRLDRAAVANTPDGRIYAYGGTTPSGTDSNELWMMDTTSFIRNWSIVPIVGPRRPTARKLSTLTFMRACNGTVGDDCLVLIGGEAGSARLSDVWAFYTTRRVWDNPANAQLAPRPPAHRSAAAVSSADGSRLYLFGGDITTGASGDMFVLSPSGFADADPNTEVANIAAGRTAFQSSIYKVIVANPALWGSPNLATNGQRGQNLAILGALQCAHTNATGTTGTAAPGEFDPWWYVDLGSVQAFDSVTVYGRTSQETGTGRYAGWQIWYGNSVTPPDRLTLSPPGGGANTLCSGMPGDIGPGEVSTVPCTGATGRYVWVYLPPASTQSRFLSLCEVEVNAPKKWQWRRLSGVTNVALNKPSFASSIYFNGAWAGSPELATDGVKTTTFPFMSHTAAFPADCNNIYLTVDLLDIYEVQSMNLWSRLEACCAMRRTRHEMYIGNSRDWRGNTRVWGPIDVSPAGSLQSISRSVNRVRGRYVTIRRAPFDPLNCANVPGTVAEDDQNVLSVVELEVIAPLLLDNPSPRFGMGFTYYRGSFVIFGGNDANGFRLNDVRFFDLATQKWLVPQVQTPLGTPPQARAWPLLLPLPSNDTLGLPIWRSPSSALVLTGGAGATGDAIGDFNVLRFAPCGPSPYDAAPGSAHGIVSESCAAAGTVCSYTCGGGFTPANPASGNTLVCNPNGMWEGVLPVCLPSSGVPPVANVQASVVGNGTARVTWNAAGSSVWPVTSYRVQARPRDWVESFAGNAFINPAAWRIATPDQPQTHRFSFRAGELYLDGAEGASCDGNNPYNCLSFIRDWPSESQIDPSGSWAIETYLRMDTTTSRQGRESQNIGLCIYDTSNVRGFTGRPLGSCEFYGGVRRSGGRWQYGWEGLFGASPFNTWFEAEKPEAYVRLERNASAGTFKISFKFRPGDEWIPNPRVAFDADLVNRGVDFPNVKIGLVARTWSGANRCLGIFSYVRVMPLESCAEPGAVRLVNATQTAAELTGLSPGRSYSFTVESAVAVQSRLLFSAPSTPSNTVTMPLTPFVAWAGPTVNVTELILARRLVEVLQGKEAGITQPSYWNNQPAVNGGPAYLNGNINDYAQAGFNNQPQPDGDWAAFDLGVVTSVKALFIVNRQGCCQGRTQRLEWYVGNSPPVGRAPWRSNTQCDMSLYPSYLSPTPVFDVSLGFAAPYSNYFQCALTGRYVYLRAPQSLNQLNVADGQFNVAELRIYASNQCPPRNGTGVSIVTPASCAAGGYGAVCVQTCRPGYVAVSGNGVATCSGDAWDAPPLICTAVCPDLNAPAYRDDCSQAFYAESFNSSAALTKWASLEPNTQALGSKWFAGDGVLVANARTGCYDQLAAVINVNKLRDWRSAFTFSARLSSSDRAGLIFKAADKLNMYRFSLDFQSATSTHRLEKIVNGDAVTVIDVSRPVTRNRWYTVAVSMDGASISITVNGERWISTVDSAFASGYFGVYSATSALFTDVRFAVPCALCQGAQDEEVCTYSCQDGLVAAGPLSRQCVSNGTGTTGLWLPDPAIAPLTCTLPPPTFIPSILSVRENSPKNAPVGDPLLGVSPAADYQLSWVILSETPFNAAVGNLFYVDSCSGQVKVRQGGSLDFERVNTYNLTVRAFILGFDTARTDQVITVRIIDVDEAPVIRDSTLLLPENPRAGAVVGMPNWTDPEGSTVIWVLDVDSSGGAFAMNLTSGEIRVSGLFPERLNFEAYGTVPYELAVTAAQPGSNPLLAGSGKVYIQLADANDAPVIGAGSVLRIAQSAFTANAAVGPVNATDEDVGVFAAPLLYTLVPPTSVAAGTVAGCAPPTDPQMYPTTAGSAASTGLFAIGTNTGTVTVAAGAVLPAWGSMTPVLSFGSLARASYSLCVNVTDGRAWTTGSVAVVVMADVGAAALVSDIAAGPVGGILSTLGGEDITFSGTGLNGAISAVFSNALFSYNATCANATGASLTCTTPPGVGSNLAWRFFLNNARVMVARELVTSYRAPVVTGMVGITNVPTNGNASGFALITGQPGTFGPPGTLMTFTYGANSEFSCAGQVAADAQTVRRCVLAPGVGRDLPWSLSIGGQTTTSSDYAGQWLISYAPPNITRIAPTCAPTPCVPRHTTANLSTAGGELLLVTGTNFGPNRIGVTDLTVTLGGAQGTLVTVTCTRGSGATAHTSLVCTTPPGSGLRHGVALAVGGQQLASGVFFAPVPLALRPLVNGTGLAYAPPVVVRVYGPGASGGPTDGGAILLIDGDNLGPLAGINLLATIDYVKYGHLSDPGRYTAADCRVITTPNDGSGSSFSTIQCLTAEGVGNRHYLQVSINGQESDLFQANVSYAPPVIAAYGGEGSANAETTGGQSVILTGLNFGPGDSNPMYGTYFQTLMRVVYGGRLEGGPVAALFFNATDCRVTKPHTEVQCLTSEGAGKGQTYTMFLDGQRSVVPTTNYAAPQVLLIRGLNGLAMFTASVNGGTQLVISGRWFGPQGYNGGNASLIQAVTYGPTGSEVVLPRANWEHLNHTAILATLPPGFGSTLRVRIQVADQLSAASTATFSYAQPAIVRIDPNTGPTLSNPRTPTIVTVTVQNMPATDASMRVTVLFGSFAAPLPITPNVPTTPGGVAAATNIDGTMNISFALPPAGGGASIGVRLRFERPNSAFVFTTTAVLFSYRAPVISTVLVSTARWLPDNRTRTNASDALPCPFGGVPDGSGFVSSCGGLLYRIEVQGSDFSLFDRDLPGSLGMPYVDTADRTLSVFVNRSSATGGGYWAVDVGGGSLLPSAEVYLHSWTHARIILASSQAESTLRLIINSTNYNNLRSATVATAAFKAVNLEIMLPLRGVDNPFATDGTDAGLVEARVRGLAGATDISIFVGPWRVPPARIFNPATGSSFASQADFMTWISTTPAGSDNTWTLRFSVPAGQGRNVPVRLVRTLPDGSTTSSSQAANLDYLPPTVASIQVLMQSDNSTLGDPIPAVAGAVVTVPTDGSVRLRLRGTNFGIAPTVTLGDGFRFGPNATLPCPPGPGISGHTCVDVIVPEGEGTGALFPEYDAFGGFIVDVEAAAGEDADTLQSSVPVRFAYAPPQITGFSSETGTFPTRGNVTIFVTGRNFGPPVSRRGDSIVLVEFFRSTTYNPNCINPARLSHSLIACTLPEGSGNNMEIRVTIADQVNVSAQNIFAYDRPRITNVSSTEGSDSPALVGVPQSAFPLLRGATNGTAVITVAGTNFGRRSTVHCVYMAWPRRNPSYPLECNDLEDHVGEGEVPRARVLSWTHEEIVFLANPGLGVKELNVLVRGNVPTTVQGALPFFRYSDPVVESVQPLTFDTEGGDIVVVRGANFGPPVFNRSNLAQFGWSELPSSERWNPAINITLAPSIPTAALAVAFHRGCVSSSVDFFGAVPIGVGVTTARTNLVPLERCDRDGVLYVDHTTMIFRAASGIGVNRTLAVSVLEGLNFPEQRSAPVNFSYSAPLITGYQPQVLAIDATRPKTARLTVAGRFFGNPDLAREQEWTDAERFVGLLVGGAQCSAPGPERLRIDGATVLRCLIDETQTPSGYRNVTIAIAGQVGVKDAWPRTQSLLLVCAFGSYGRMNETCAPCPEQGATPAQRGAACDGFLPDESLPMDVRFSYPKPLPGWYNLNTTDSIATLNSPGVSMLVSACPPGRQHLGRDVCIVPCEPAEACLGDNFCEAGYTSKAPYFRCASCAKGFFKRAGQCIKCPDSPYMLVVGFILLIAVAAGLGVVLQKKQVNIAVVSIGVDFFQVLAIFSQSKIKWPPAIKELFHVLSAFNLNIEIVAPECLMPDVSYIQKFSAVMCLPIAVGGTMALMSIGLIFVKLAKGRKRNELMRHVSTQVGLVLVLMYFLYLYETRTLLDTFNCAPTEPPDGREYLQAVFEECGKPGGTQVTLIPWSIVGLAVYTVGYPAFVLYWVLYRNRVMIMEDQLLRAKGVGNDRLTNPHAYDLRKRFSRSYFQFKPDYWFWFGAIIVRKFCIAATSILFNRNATFQMAACLLVMFCAYGLHLACRPYMSPSDYEGVLKEHTEKAFSSSLHAKLRASIISVESRGRRKARKNLMTPEGKVDRTAVLGLLGGWLFNYNTVEAAMLYAGVIVCLMGLMFDALNRGFASVYAERGRDSVTSVALGVIILAIFYYFGVLVTEAYSLYTEDQREKALKAAAARKAGKGPAGTGASSKRLSVAPSNVPSGMAKGSIYDRAGSGGKGGFNTGALESSFNPLALQSSRKLGGDSENPYAQGVSLGLDASAMEVVETVASMAQPPPPDVWRVVQGAFKDMHGQVIDGKMREIALLNQLAVSAGGGDPLGGGSRTSFEPQAAGGAGAVGIPSVAGGGTPRSPGAGLASFRSAGSSVRR